MLLLIARYGSSTPLCRTQLVKRLSACAAELAWTVEIVPECPVFRSCSRSKASAPRISPSRIRSGLCRRLALSRSLIVTAGSHFALAGLQSGPGSGFESESLPCLR